MAMNLAQDFSKKVDERFSAASYAEHVVGNAYEFDGVDTVNVYSVPTAPMADYDRHGLTRSDRYGTAVDLQASVQRMQLTKDRSFSYVIDRGDLIQSRGVMNANQSLARQINEVIIPEYDNYVFHTLAAKATAMGNYTSSTVNKSTAYTLFLKGQEFLGDHMAPDQGRIAVCSYAFSSLLRQDTNFIRSGDLSQKMLSTGIIGEVDGVQIMRVPSSRLPAGCCCIMTHPYASVAPRQLREYKIHDNPVGISGYKVEGRFLYDCFVLDNKANGIFYIGSSGVLRVLDVTSAPSVTAGQALILVSPVPETGCSWYYRTGTTKTAVTYGKPISASDWTALPASGTAVTPASGDTLVEVVEADSNLLPLGYGCGKLNLG